MLNVIDPQLLIGHAVRYRNRARQEVGVTVHMHRAKKPCRGHREGSHRRSDDSQGATDHRRSQNASPGQGSSPWQSGMMCRLTSAMCLTIVSTSTQGSPPVVLLPQGKG